MAHLEPDDPFDDAHKYIDPVYESLKLRAEAAEEAVIGNKHHASCMALRSKAAALELKKARLMEERTRYDQRGQFCLAQADRQKIELENRDTIANQVAVEMNRHQEKAAQLRRKCASLDAKISKLDEKIHVCREQADQEERLKSEAMQKSKELEIQALKYERR